MFVNFIKIEEMSKPITLTLTEAEYEQLMANYLLGNLIGDEVNELSQEELMQATNLVNKLCEAGFKNKVTGYKQLQSDLYCFSKEVEDQMLLTYNDFIDYVKSGERAEEVEAIKAQIDEMRKKGLV